MNEIVAKVVQIRNKENLHVVKFETQNQCLTMLSLELADIKIGLHVRLSIKPISIAIAKDFSGSISFSNKLSATIKEINKGELMCSIKLTFEENELEAVMTIDGIENMDLRVGDTVTLFIKASEIYLKEIL